MKKLIILSLSALIGLQFMVSSNAKAQNFQIVASFGSAHHWGVPAAVIYEIDYFYPFHRFVHVDRTLGRGRNIFFNVLLERHGRFVELTFGRNGQIFEEFHFRNYPLIGHICAAHCGYHSNYYFQQRRVCNANHHRGHNHINFRRQPRQVHYVRNIPRHHVHNSNRHSVYRGSNRSYDINRNPNVTGRVNISRNNSRATVQRANTANRNTRVRQAEVTRNASRERQVDRNTRTINTSRTTRSAANAKRNNTRANRNAPVTRTNRSEGTQSVRSSSGSRERTTAKSADHKSRNTTINTRNSRRSVD